MKLPKGVTQITGPSSYYSVGCLFLGLLVVGSLLFSAKSLALEYDVTAKVASPPPTNPAIISSPTDQQHFTVPFISVGGTCGDGAYVLLIRNEALAGVGACSGGTFTITIQLAEGNDLLRAKNYNKTDTEGPSSSPVTVYYDIPQVNTPDAILPELDIKKKDLTDTPPSQSQTSPPSLGQSLFLSAPFTYRVYKVNEVWKGDISVSGGAPPYTVAVDWKDSSVSHLKEATQVIKINHTYTKPSNYQPIIRVTDSQGSTGSLQLLIPVIASSPPTPVLSPLAMAAGIAGIVVLTGLTAAVSFTFKKPSARG